MKDPLVSMLVIICILSFFLGIDYGKSHSAQQTHVVPELTIYTNSDIYYLDFDKLQATTETNNFVMHFQDVEQMAKFIENKTAEDIKN